MVILLTYISTEIHIKLCTEKQALIFSLTLLSLKYIVMWCLVKRSLRDSYQINRPQILPYVFNSVYLRHIELKNNQTYCTVKALAQLHDIFWLEFIFCNIFHKVIN